MDTCIQYFFFHTHAYASRTHGNHPTKHCIHTHKHIYTKHTHMHTQTHKSHSRYSSDKILHTHTKTYIHKTHTQRENNLYYTSYKTMNHQRWHLAVPSQVGKGITHTCIHRHTRATHSHDPTKHYTHTHTHKHTHINTHTQNKHAHTRATHGHHPWAVSRFYSPVSELPYRTWHLEETSRAHPVLENRTRKSHTRFSPVSISRSRQVLLTCTRNLLLLTFRWSDHLCGAAREAGRFEWMRFPGNFPVCLPTCWCVVRCVCVCVCVCVYVHASFRPVGRW
jgi:hypothetical protein